MNALPQIYQDAVKTIKQAILESQCRAAKMINGEQLSLYFGIGCYVSEHSRTEWGTGAIDAISEQLRKELPGLHGFSAESIKKMRLFYEFWSRFLNRSPMATDTNRAFVEYAVRDYTKPMGVATYKTLGEMPKAFRDALPDEDELKKLL